jgi:hypothetical protein
LALAAIPLVITLVLFSLFHPILADPPTLEETYQKWIKTRVDSLIVRGRLRLTPYAPMKYNMPIAKPDPNIVYNMPIAKPDPNIVYNMPGARTPRKIPRLHLPKQFSLLNILKLGAIYIPFQKQVIDLTSFSLPPRL